MKHLTYIFILSFAISIIAQTNNPYVHKGSLGKKVTKEEVVPKKAFDFIPISEWVGESFIFLPQSKHMQKYGYLSFGITYHKYVGRIAKVISVSGDDITHKLVFKMEDNGEELNTTFNFDSIDGIALVADIDNARSRWLNKTLWFKKKELSVYDEKKDTLFSIKIRKCSPVKVIDIIAGWDNYSPVRFSLQCPSGDEGFVDINLSGTNVSVELRNRSLSKIIFSPRIQRKLFIGLKQYGIQLKKEQCL